MSVAIPIPLLQHLPDVNVTLGAGVHGYSLVWDNSTARFVLTQQTTIVIEGESTSKYEVERWPYYVRSCWPAYGRADVTNVAANSETITQMLAQYAAQVHPHAPAPGKDAYFTLFAGINDINNSRAAVDVYADFKTEWANARADGFKVVAFTVTPSTLFNGAKETQRLALNALIRSDPSLYDYLVQPDIAMPDPNGVYYSDGTHQSVLGATVLAQLVGRALDREPYLITTGAADSTIAGDDLILNPGGRFVGIKTTLPGTELHVATTATTSPRGIMSSQHSTGADGARIYMRKSRGTNTSPTAIVTGDVLGRLAASGYDGANYLEMGAIDIAAVGTIVGTKIPTEMRFLTATNATPSVLTQRMVLDRNGNLGLGTTAPKGILDIRNLGGYDAPGDGTGGTLALGLDSNFWTFRMTNSPWGDLAIDRAVSGTHYEFMRVQRTTGNVGFGTTAPKGILDIRNPGGYDTPGDGTGGTLTLGIDSNFWTFRMTNSPWGDLAVDRAVSGTHYEFMRFQRTTGNVGIGDTAPAEKLDVTGNINTTGVYKVDDVQVLSNRVIDARCADVANSGDATTDGLIDALRDAMVAHGLIAAA